MPHIKAIALLTFEFDTSSVNRCKFPQHKCLLHLDAEFLPGINTVNFGEILQLYEELNNFTVLFKNTNQTHIFKEFYTPPPLPQVIATLHELFWSCLISKSFIIGAFCLYKTGISNTFGLILNVKATIHVIYLSKLNNALSAFVLSDL